MAVRTVCVHVQDTLSQLSTSPKRAEMQSEGECAPTGVPRDTAIEMNRIFSPHAGGDNEVEAVHGEDPSDCLEPPKQFEARSASCAMPEASILASCASIGPPSGAHSHGASRSMSYGAPFGSVFEHAASSNAASVDAMAGHSQQH